MTTLTTTADKLTAKRLKAINAFFNLSTASSAVDQLLSLVRIAANDKKSGFAQFSTDATDNAFHEVQNIVKLLIELQAANDIEAFVKQS